MATAFLWGGIGVFVLFILIGFLAGFIRGLKRSALHIIFFVVSFVIAFFITKPITSAILGISLTIDGTATTLNDIIYTFLNKQFDLSAYTPVADFTKTLPLSVASPIMFIIIALVTYLLFDIIYLIVARIAFGKKKVDFSERKPLRWYGSCVGVVESFLFMFLLFAPLTSLTQTYQSLATYSAQENASATYVISQQEQSSKLPLLSEVVQDYVPQQVDEAIKEFNNCIIGKISGAGGLNHALFDYLSSSKVNEEKIHFRKDLLALADTYNEFAVAYNKFSAKDYENIELTKLKENLEKFLDEGIFKGVIAPTVQDYVVKFDVQTAPDFIKSNQLLSDLVVELQTAFNKPDFVAKTYLKDDLLKIVDIAEEITDKKLIQEVQNLESKNFVDILKVVSKNSQSVKEIVDSAFKLHILNDGFDAIGKFASEKLSEFVDNQDVKLNLSAENKSQLISNTLDALDDVLAVTDKIDISKLLDGDLMGGISGVEKIDEVLVDVGKAFDKIRGLEILVFEEQENPYIFDKILESFDVSLLGDEVQDKTIGENGKINSYEAFFTAISKPVKIAQDLNLFEIDKEGQFEEILNKLLDKMHEKTQPEGPENFSLVSDVLMPFYELQKASLKSDDKVLTVKEMVFDSIIDQLEQNVQQLNFETIKTSIEQGQVQDAYAKWKSELDQMGKVLLLLDDKDHTIEDTETYTYIRYILSTKVSGTDDDKVTKVFDSIKLDTQHFENILGSLFDSSVFDNLIDQIFNQLDETVEGLTGFAPEKMTNHKDLIKGKETEVKQMFVKLLEFSNKHSDLQSIDFAEIGELLNSLKASAKNGEDDGVFKGVFENLIWYLTSDTSINSTYYNGKQSTFEDASTVKNYLAASDYYQVNYGKIFAELQDVKDFAEALDVDKIEIDVSSGEQKMREGVDAFIGKLNVALKVLEDKGKDKNAQADVINNANKYRKASGNQTELLDETLRTNEQLTPIIKEEIRKAYNPQDAGETDSALTTAILGMLGLSD